MPRRTKLGTSMREVLTTPEVIRRLNEHVPGFSRASFLAALFEEIGGEKAFARIVAREINGGKAGSVALQRNIDGVMRMLNWDSNDKRAVPVEELSEAELLASIRATLPRLETAADQSATVALPGAQERFEE